MHPQQTGDGSRRPRTRPSAGRRPLPGGTAALAAALILAAAAAPPTATAAEVDGGEIVSVIISASDLPEGQAIVGVGRFELGAGASVTSPAGSQPPSVAVETVLDGAYGVTSDGLLRIIRAPGPDGAVDTVHIEDGQPVTLEPGDSVVHLDNAEAASVARNLDETPVVGIAAGIFSTSLAEEEWVVEGDYTFDFLAFAPAGDWASVPRGDVRLTILRDPDPVPEPVAGGLRLDGELAGGGSIVVLVEPVPAGE